MPGWQRGSVRPAILRVKSPVLTQKPGKPVPASEAPIPVGVKRDRDARTVVRMRHLKLRCLGEESIPDFGFLGGEGKLYGRVREHRGNSSEPSHAVSGPASS